eukprot:763388-Hanusia_phi.AAC.10
MRSKNTGFDMTYNREMYERGEDVGAFEDEEAQEASGKKKRSYTKRKKEGGLGSGMYEQGSMKRVRLDKKWSETDTVDIDDIVNQVLLPDHDGKRSTHTIFSLSEWETAEHIVQMLFKECPTITKSKMEFTRHMSYLYDKLMFN